MADFGISEVISAISWLGSEAAAGASAAAGAAGAVGSAATAGAEALGIPGGIATGIGGGVTGGLESAATQGGIAALTGGNVGQALERGAIEGATIGGLGPGIGSVTGLGQQAGDAIAGALGGAGSSALTGGNPLSGALRGGVEGFVAPTGAKPASGGGTGGGGPAGAATPAPASAPASSPDITGLGGGGSSLPNEAALGGSPAAGGASTAALPGSVGAGAAAPGGTSEVNLPSANANPLGIQSASDTLAPNAASSVPALSAPTSPTVTPSKGNNVIDLFGEAKKNPLAAANAVGLASTVLRGNQKPPGYNDVQALAKSSGQQGAALKGYLASGTLPPGVQQSLDAAVADAASSVKSQYASRGLTGSSAEAQDLQNLQLRMREQATQIATQLFSQGVNEEQISASLYGQLMQAALQQDAQLGQAFGSFATALAGGQRTGTGG